VPGEAEPLPFSLFASELMDIIAPSYIRPLAALETIK